MKEGIIRANKSHIDSVVEVLPQKPTIKNKVLNVIYESENGLTPKEILEETHIAERRIREAVSLLKANGLIKSKQCRCGHSPIFYK